MGTSDIAITALAATPTLRGNKLKATVLATGPAANIPNLLLQTVIFYASLTNDFATAAEVARGNPEALDAGLIEERTYYYWARAIDASGNLGPVYPASPTAGVACKAIGLSGLAFGIANARLTASVAGDALTIALKTSSGNDPTASDPVYLAFRNAALTAGNYDIFVQTSPMSLVISAGSSLGGRNGFAFRIWIVVFNDNGTLRMGVQNCSNGASLIFPLTESGVASAIAEGGAGAADSFGVFYAAQTVTSKPFRIVGYMDFNQGFAFTAGNWIVPPHVIQLFGQGIRTPGSVLQDYSETSFAMVTTTSVIPLDNTIPQSSEGASFFNTASIVADSKCNFLEIDLLLNVSHSAVGPVLAALFRGISTNAVTAGWAQVPAAGAVAQLRISDRFPVTDDSGFYLRVGAAVAGTLTVNGVAGAAMLSQRLVSKLRIAEIMG